MKEMFKEFYVNEIKIDQNSIDEKTVIVLDTNVLLRLYAASPSLYEQLTSSIKRVEKYLWMPYQVGFEFHINRKKKMYDVRKQINGFPEKLESSIKKTIDKEKSDFYKSYSGGKELLDTQTEIFDNITVTLEKEIKKLKGNLDIKERNPVEFLGEVFKGKVNDFANNDYENWQLEGESRYDKDIPPGYSDKEKTNLLFFNKEFKAKFGDFFLWKEMLEYARNKSIKNIIFVTEDMKEDWMHIIQNEKIGPRIELIHEMMSFADANFKILNIIGFLRSFGDNKDNIKTEIVNELEDFPSQDDLYFNNQIYKLLNNDLNKVSNDDININEMFLNISKNVMLIDEKMLNMNLRDLLNSKVKLIDMRLELLNLPLELRISHQNLIQNITEIIKDSLQRITEIIENKSSS